MDLLERQEDRQRQREEADRQWREKQAERERQWREEDRRWRQEDIALLKEGMRSSVRTQISVAAIGAFAALAAAAFGYWLASFGT